MAAEECECVSSCVRHEALWRLLARHLNHSHKTKFMLYLRYQELQRSHGRGHIKSSNLHQRLGHETVEAKGVGGGLTFCTFASTP